MRKLYPVCILLVLVLVCAAQSYGQTDPFLGTWKLNVQKSKFSPGSERKGETRVVTSNPMGMKVSVDRVKADGSTQHFEYTTNLDGKSYPFVGDGPYGADSITANLSNPNTINSTLKKNGKTVATATGVVSADGKTFTITAKGTDSAGKHFSDVAVYEKQ